MRRCRWRSTAVIVLSSLGPACGGATNATSTTPSPSSQTTQVWADEFDSLWLTGREVERVRAAGRLFYVISPEIHGFEHDAMLRRWKDFRAWHVDGVCTDYALEAREFFR